MSINTVTVVGAHGNLGGPLVTALLGAGSFRVSVLQRASSTSGGPPAGATLLTVDDGWTTEALTAVLRGQDAVVVAFPLRDLDAHLRLATAAAAAGVQRYVPADYGSVDARSPTARALVPLFEKKETVRARLEALAAATPGFTYTSIVGGHFFDWGLKGGFLHAFLDTHTAEILGDGNGRSSLSTLARLGEATVALLRRGADDAATANRVLMVQSFCVSQNELLAALERATGGMPWMVTRVDTDAYIRERKAAADGGDLQAVEDLVYVLGVLEGDWTAKPEYSMELLGLQDEDLDAVVASVVASVESK